MNNTRFRKGKVTLVTDIESMYHQVLVDTQDRKYLKFLCWPSGNTTLPPAKYCMKVHVFGVALVLLTLFSKIPFVFSVCYYYCSRKLLHGLLS